MNIVVMLIVGSYLGFVVGKYFYYNLFCGTKNPRFLEKNEKKSILKELNNLLSEAKFISKDFYPGIESIEKLPIYTDIIQDVIEYFIQAVERDEKKEQSYQEIIEYGLNKFEVIYLEIDTEDKERICDYFDQLLNIVGIMSSKGKINNFNRPGFIKLFYLMYFKK